jgi:uncharacterized protein (TIGR02646 family)
MIRLFRQAEPPELSQNRHAWTTRWRSIRDRGGKQDWATQQAKQLLRLYLSGMSLNKCAFCESRLGVSTYLEIEHYIAKTVDESKAFEWTNLLPSCRSCNSAKADNDHQNALLKPDAEDPEPYFWLKPEGQIVPHPKLTGQERERAQRTIQVLDLNRGGLMTSRYEIGRLVGEVLRSRRKALLDTLLEPEREYKFAIRQRFEQNNNAELAEEDRRRFQAKFQP